jgi:hypothetical protein
LTGAIVTYLLCLATSLACAGLLARAYYRGRSRLILWTSISFVFFAINNLLLVADTLVFTSIDLLPWRQLAAALGVGTLIYGFVWESR